MIYMFSETLQLQINRTDLQAKRLIVPLLGAGMSLTQYQSSSVSKPWAMMMLKLREEAFCVR
jgi:hypothetical protein